MLDIKEIRIFFIRHGYLLIIAAWLFTFSFLFSNYWSYYSSPQGVKRSLEKSIREREDAFQELSTDSTLIEHIFARDHDEKEEKLLSKQSFYVFAYDSSTASRWLVYWSTNLVLPDEWQAPLQPGIRFLKLKNGYYEVICKKVQPQQAGHERYLMAAIPVMMEYNLSNNYLVDHFFDKPALGMEYTIHLKPPGIPVLNGQNLILFYLYYDRTLDTGPPNLLSVILRVLGCICVLIFVNLFATTLARQKNPLYGFFFLFTIIIVCRR